jgi:Zn-dependent peptidase ImmA (M78 family)/transcriptional regulator with XRE-family HTH domain
VIKKTYSSTFVPIIHAADYDDYAADFLRRYEYEEAITTPMPVPIWDIAQKKMELVIQRARLSENGDDISGLIALEDGIVDIYDDTANAYVGVSLKKGVVLLEAFCFNEGRQNNSLAHECVHWWLHRLYFVNRKGQAVAFRCPRRIEESGEKPTDEEWMEIQARGIGGRILMPKEATKVKIAELLVAHSLTKATAKDSDYETIAAELAAFFHVSKLAASIRLSQLGYAIPQARQEYTASTHMPTDKQREQARQGLLGQHTQKPEAQDFFQEYCRNEVLRDILSDGKFRFVDGYFVINNAKYITATADAKKVPILTQYAREHLDECTLGFVYKRENKGTPQSLTDILFRKQEASAYNTSASFINDNQNSAVLSKAARSSKPLSEFEKKYALIRKTTKTLGERLKELQVLLDIRNKEVVAKTGLTDAMVDRLRNDRNESHDILTMVKLCAGLDLEPTIAHELFTLAGVALTATTPQNYAYQIVINQMHGQPAEAKEQFLEANGFKRLDIQDE